MEPHEKNSPENLRARRDLAVSMCAPGTALRKALDMIIDGHLGALISIGDEEAVLAVGDSGFKLDVSFTANRLFELCKMDGAVVIDKDLTQIYRANYHLNPDPSIPTNETGTRHRTAARMSQISDAVMISVSERRSVVSVYVGGKSFMLRPVPEILTQVNQLMVAMQSTRTQLDRRLLRLTSLELENYVTLADVTDIFYLFEVLISTSDQLEGCIRELGTEGKATSLQRDEYLGDMDETYTLMIRDYARDSTEENAKEIRKRFRETANTQLRSSRLVAELLGYEDKHEDSIMTSLGLRTLSRVSVVREGMADKLIREYGSLQRLLDAVEDDPSQLGEIVNNPKVLANSLQRMQGSGV